MESLPVLNTPFDTLRSGGPNSSNFASLAQRRHPVDTLQRSTPRNADSATAIDARATAQGGLDLHSVSRLYGSGLAMRLATERKMAASVGGRLPGFDSVPRSDAMVEALTGEDMCIGFDDYLNLPENRPDEPRLILHGAMEVKLGLN
eukprot:CAMPEP_0113309722 /NCGR_PEP_ID=MMETSP0010_2-20120614/7650_1 /TAXON_ID=216773 ORGANISM="Corethron hystrix, Strain 308" /NCGR_SAMPLE_ID=MMETSP0010_2 /ASSEMBLY_ACC=CAM_ASM_000155 /LENGTH=146 /DNA_ID=CAMNT_0000165027 /DNA_START=81 /DNA_END=521 /DNA_ORIENTATION=+ /assembly_acc=CAM_ASM_000155